MQGSGAPSADDLAQVADQMRQQMGAAASADAPSIQIIPAAAPNPTTAGSGAQEPVFVSLFEKKEAAKNPRPTRRGGSGNYVVNFYLVDAHGALHHAATGVDSGDSHYEYTNETGYPALFCHNKNDVRAWADQVMARSQERAGYKTDVVTDEVPTEGPVQLPTFVSYSETKEELPDGRHRLRWYLLDVAGHNHLAMTGEEKETRDGHYAYHTESIFNYAAPLEAGNQEAVHRWLEAMIAVPHEAGVPAATHPTGGKVQRGRAGPQPGGGGSGGGSGIASGGIASGSGFSFPQYHAFTPGSGGGGRGRRGRGRGRGPGRPPRSGLGRTGGGGGGRYGADSLLRQATGNVGRRGRGGFRMADPDRDARELVAAELRRWAQEEAIRREASKRAAMAFTGQTLTDEEAAVVARCLPILQSAAKAGASYLPAGAQAGSAAQRRNLVALLGALREVSHLRACLALTSQTDLKPALATLSRSAQPDVATVAAATLQQWLRAATASVQIFADPRYAEDPRPMLDVLVGNTSRFDPVVTAITHRHLAPPGQAHAGHFVPGGGSTPGGPGPLTFGSPALGMSAGPASGFGAGSAGPSFAGGSSSGAAAGGGGGGGGGAGGTCMESQPSGVLVDGPASAGLDSGAEILPPEQQEMVLEGVEF